MRRVLAAGGEIVISNFDLEEFAQNSAVALTENGSTTLPLVADHATHGDFLDRDLEVSIQEERPLRPGGGSLSSARTSNRRWACRVGGENSSAEGLCGL